MSSPTPTRPALVSSSSLPTIDPAAEPTFDGDAAATICAFLIYQGGLTCARVAHHLGLPPLVVEECVRNADSSPALRAQLGQWLQENSRMASTVPPLLMRSLYERCASDAIAAQKRARRARDRAPVADATDAGTPGSPPDDSDGSLFSALDPLSRQHFTALRDSVGHSFVSILIDPGDRSGGGDGETSAWGGWLGSKLYEAFDYNGRTGVVRLDEALRALQQRVLLSPESSPALLARHPPQTDFGDYLRAVSAAYSANQREGRELRRSGPQAASQAAEGLPWPRSVPAAFFAAAYDVRGELEALPAPLPSADDYTALLPTTTTGASANDLSALERVRVVGPATFRADFAALEARHTELRAWEAEVEGCLLHHVQSRSEDFFIASRSFTQLREEGHAAVAKAREARTGGLATGALSVRELLGVGALYRRRANVQVLQAFLDRARRVFSQLQRVDNWVALPERDAGELPGVVQQLCELEAFLRTGSGDRAGPAEGEGGGAAAAPRSPELPLDAWQWMSRLRFMRDVPKRVAAARAALEAVVQAEVVQCLLGSVTEPAQWPRVVRAVESAAQLGVLDAALLTHQAATTRALWVAVEEVVVSLMLSSNTLNDAQANELLTRAAATVAAADSGRAASEPSSEEKRALLACTDGCRFGVFLSLLTQIVDLLALRIADIAQGWGFMITECLPQALSMYDGPERVERVGRATRSLLGAVCSSAEAIVALLVDVRSGSSVVTSAAEVERIARHAFGLVPLALAPVRELAALPGLPAGAALVEDALPEAGTTSTERSEPPPAGSSASARPARLGRYIAAAVHKLGRRFLKAQHARHMEKLQLVVEAETWAPKEDVDPTFQASVEELRRSDAVAVAAFDAKCVERAARVGQASDGPDGLQGSGAHPGRRRTATALRGDEEDGLMGKASKLYLSLDGEGEGRVVGNSLLILIELLSELDALLARFPSLGFEVVTRMYELVALFDSLCAGMVLGARALERGVLRSITVTHLCVASQCTAFLVDLVPALQRRLKAVLRVGGGSDTPSSGPLPPPPPLAYTSSSTQRLLPFIETDLGRVVKDCTAHRDELLLKITTLVLVKVDSLGAMEAGGEWSARGNDWVMTMLREVARLIRTLRPLLPAADVRGVVVPLLGTLATNIREVTRCVPASAADARAMATSDVLLFKLNVERFGYDVLRCAGVSTVAAAMAAEDLAPVTSDEEALLWFFPPVAKQPQAQAHQWPSSPRRPAS